MSNDTITVTNYFGGCPTCGDYSGMVNAGRTHVFFCSERKVSWIAGANLFAVDETREEQIERYKAIEGFERVEPLFEAYGRPIPNCGSAG
jgi:hypothetical protein